MSAIIASLTSWPKRIGTAHETIESIMDQSQAPDSVELNLFTGDFPKGRQDIPQRILDLENYGPLRIYFHDRDLKVWLKSYPAIKRHDGEEYILFTLDDDCVYARDYIKEAVASLDSGDYDVINTQSGICKDGVWQGIAGEYMAYRSKFLHDCLAYLNDDFCERVMVDDCAWFWLFRKFGVRQAPRTSDGLARDRLLGFSYRRCFNPGDASTMTKNNGEYPMERLVDEMEFMHTVGL